MFSLSSKVSIKTFSSWVNKKALDFDSFLEFGKRERDEDSLCDGGGKKMQTNVRTIYWGMK